MTLEIVICKVCGNQIGKVHGHKVPEIYSEHMLYNHRDTYIELANLYEEIERLQIERLQGEFKEKSGRYSREGFYYQLRFVKE